MQIENELNNFPRMNEKDLELRPSSEIAEIVSKLEIKAYNIGIRETEILKRGNMLNILLDSEIKN